MSPRRLRPRKPSVRLPVGDKHQAMSSRLRRPVRGGSVQSQKPALGSPVVDKPEGSKLRKRKYSPLVLSPGSKLRKRKYSPPVPSPGSKLRKRKYSPHVPSPGTKAEEPKTATLSLEEGDETSFRFTSDNGDPSVPGTKAYKEMVATCRRLHEWSKGSCCIFEFDPSSLDTEGKEPKTAASSSQEALEVEEPKTAALSLKEDLEHLYASLTFQPGADVLDGSFFANSDDDTSDASSVTSIQYNYDYDSKVRRTEGLFDPPNVEF